MNKQLVWSEEELPQKSKKWLKFRDESGFGASQIPIILGNYPPQWSSPYELFLEKMGKPKKEAHIDTERGELENEAREFITDYYNSINTIVCDNVYDRTENTKLNNTNFEQYTVQHKEINNIFASYDGIDFQNKLVLEIKCPKEGIFKTILKNKIPKVPKTYLAQVQFQLLIANSHWNIDRGIFAVYHPEGFERNTKNDNNPEKINLILIETKLDKNYCEDVLLTCNKFFEMVELRKWRNNWNK